MKVYQKDSYDENVTKPIEEVILRDPDENGNYVVNGDFSVKEDLTDEKDWTFLTALGGEAEAEIGDNEIAVNTVNAGTVDYSVQLVQPDLPMKQGGVYQLKFDAYADAERTMKVAYLRLTDLSGVILKIQRSALPRRSRRILLILQ